MPKGVSRKVKIRAGEVMRLLRLKGCITPRHVTELGFTETQAKVALMYFEKIGLTVCANLNGVKLCCRSRRSALRRLRKLKYALHSALCAKGIRYPTPKKAFGVIMSDGKLKEAFSRYVHLSPRNRAMWKFIGGLLRLMYGEPLYVTARRKPVFFADCSRKPLPTPPTIFMKKKEYTTVSFRVEPPLKEELEKLAETLNISVSDIVKYAIQNLLSRYFADYR